MPRATRARFAFGQGVVKDEALAFEYYEQSGKQGYALAQYNTGINYREGRGCEQSYQRSVEWFELAAAQNDSDAQVALGRLYYQVWVWVRGCDCVCVIGHIHTYFRAWILLLSLFLLVI